MKRMAKAWSFIKEDGTWYDAEDKKFPVNQDSLTTMTNTLGAVSATRKLEKPEALSEYGLDSPVLTVRYTASDGKEAEFIVGDTNDAAGGAYLKISGDDAVYLVSSDFADSFNSDIYQLADHGKLSDHHIRQHYRYQCEFEWPYTGDQERQ